MTNIKEKKKTIVYGHLTEERKAELERYLSVNGMEPACPPLMDEGNGDRTYPELRKALYFALRLGCRVTLVSVREETSDPSFLEILEETECGYDCIDFPWLRKENIPLLKALSRYMGGEDE